MLGELHVLQFTISINIRLPITITSNIAVEKMAKISYQRAPCLHIYS